MDTMRIVLLSLVFFFVLSTWSAAQTKSVTDLANYRGADREEMLKAGAKKEGKLVWYTSLTAHRDIANVFEAKYPGYQSRNLSRGSHGPVEKTADRGGGAAQHSGSDRDDSFDADADA